MKTYRLFFLSLVFLLVLHGCTKTDLTVNTPSNTIKTPANLVATAFSSSRIDLRWTDSSNNEEGFKILRKMGTGSFTQIATVAQNVVTYSDTALSPEETYSYAVFSYNATSNSVNSNTANATTLPGIPNAPSNLKAVVYDATQIDLSWTDLSGNELGFKIERKTGTGAFVVVATVARNEVKYADVGLVLGTTYTYRVTAYNNLGNSSYTAPLDAIPVLTPNPSPTTNDLFKVHFVTDNIGFIAGNKVVLKTTNGGTTWNIVRENASITYTAVKFIDALNGYIGGNDQYYSYLYQTTDGGITWTEIDKKWFQNNPIRINDIAYANNTLMYVLNAPTGGRMYGNLYFLTNNVVTRTLTGNNNQGFNCLDIVNGNLLIGGAVYWDGSKYVGGALTVNNFTTPQLNSTNIGLAENINGISAVSNKAIAVGDKGSLSVSSNNGLSWTSRTITGYSAIKLSATVLLDANNGFVVGDGGLLLNTSDGSVNWTKVNNANTENVNSIAKKPNGSVYMVGNKGTIIKIK